MPLLYAGPGQINAMVPFDAAEYTGGVWVVDWDHRLPSRHVVLRLYAHYSGERRAELDTAYTARQKDVAPAGSIHV